MKYVKGKYGYVNIGRANAVLLRPTLREKWIWIAKFDNEEEALSEPFGTKEEALKWFEENLKDKLGVS